MSMGADRRWRSGAILAVVSVAAIAAAGLPSPRLSAIRLAGPGGTLTIDSLHTSATWLGVALAQAGDVTLDNVTFELGGVTYRLPRVAFSGASLSRHDLVSLFDPNASEASALRIARLSAREARIPELRIEQAITGGKQVTIYRDVIARDIVNGRIASLTSAGATFEIAGAKAGTATGSAGQLVVENLDLAFAASLYGQNANPSPPTEARTVYASFSLDEVILGDAAGTHIRIGRMAGKDFKARPSARSWSETMRILRETQDLAKASPAERSRLFGALADLHESFAMGSTEATGIEIRDAKAKDQAIGRIARLAFSDGGPQGAEARADGLEITTSNGTVRIGAIVFAGISLRDTLQGFRELGGRPIEKLDPADLRKLVPTIGTVRISGLDVDMLKAKAAKPDGIRFGVRDIDITADKPINGIPTNLRVAVNNLTLAVPPSPEDDGLKTLAAMGYGALDLSLTAAASWNEPGNELVIRELSVRGADMGSAALRGVLANVGRDVFNPDSAVAAVALVGASARNFHLTIENQGLFERFIAQEARKQKKSPDEIRREYAMAAAIGVPAMLGNAAAAKQLGQAVARFIAKPGRLTIAATTKSPTGLGIADIVATPEPAAILEKLEVTATAE